MKVIAIVGKKKTGKTTLSCKIIEALNKRGYDVSSVKHTHHVNMDLDKEGTDTYKHKEAGSSFVIGSSETTFINTDEVYDLDQLLTITKMIKNPDFVVVEGFKNYPYANISTSDLDEFENNSDYDYNIKQVDVFNLSDEELEELVDLIEERSYGIINSLNPNSCGYSNNESLANDISKGKVENKEHGTKGIVLTIDGQVIPLNTFVRVFMKNTINGMLNSLKTKEYGVKEKKTMNLMIENFDD